MIVATSSKFKNFEGLPLSSYTLERWGKISQMLEEEDQHTPMMLPEGINRAKVEGDKADKRFIPLIEASSEDLYINKEGDTMEWL